ncbi:MAG: c-type cytochrome [Gammaproteobacteria bacterium]
MKKHTQIAIIILILLISGLLGFCISLYQHRLHNPISSRVLGDVQTIETFHYPALFVKQLTGDPKAGEKIFKQFCTSCHGNPPVIDINAPRIGDTKTWQLKRQMGMPTLMKITTEGLGAMPARGGCFECSDEQLRETIQYMLNQSDAR